MNIQPQRKIILFGMMSRHPVPGVIWQTIHYLVGLQRLGYDVFYVEAHAANPSMFYQTNRVSDQANKDDGSQRAAAFINEMMKRFGLGNDHWCFQALHSNGRCYGLGESELKRLYQSAALLINLHGATVPRPEHCATGRLIYLETDPVALQIELYENQQETIDFLEPHSAFFTFGENYGNPDCKLPVSERFSFRPTRQPVILDYWLAEPKGGELFTTIGNWRQQWRDVSFQGETFHWSKHYEFLKFIDLPQHTTQLFELALSRVDETDRKMLERQGWKVRNSLAFAMDIDAYRQYIGESRGEFTVAKDQNVRLRSGWFSDRSATYLAAGRPVITQETGFSNIFPSGEGLFGFSTLEEILRAIEEINANYEAHCKAARAIARDYFSDAVVLPRLLADVGL
jgi:hypothetical protein